MHLSVLTPGDGGWGAILGQFDIFREGGVKFAIPGQLTDVQFLSRQ